MCMALCWLTAGLLVCMPCVSQNSRGRYIWDAIIAIENAKLDDAQKLQRALALQREFQEQKLPEDSVYARLLHRIATLEFLMNAERATKESVDNMLQAIAINTSGKKGASPDYVINSYYNLAAFFESLHIGSKALLYYDSVIIINRERKLENNLATACRVLKAEILFRNGDYQQCIDECVVGLAEGRDRRDTEVITQLFNRRAQSYAYLNQVENALADTDSSAHYAAISSDDYELATAMMIKATVRASDHPVAAERIFEKAIGLRLRTHAYRQISDDYTDFGNFYFRRLQRYKQAQDCYQKTLWYAQKAGDNERLCKGYINLAETASRISPQNGYAATRKYYRLALQVFGMDPGDMLQNPPLSRFSAIGNTDLLLVILNNKTELLLNLYRLNGDREYLRGCLSTARVMDSAIDQARRQQMGEQSKLYWRQRAGTFFATAISACYLDNNAALAFYFMEKSRAVLLSDKLNELGAAAHLPEEENNRGRVFLQQVAAEEQRLRQLSPNEPSYTLQELRLVQAQDSFQRYIKRIEQKYPAYYRYKYADRVPLLSELQMRLQQYGESFVHYFVGDSLTYMLAVLPNQVKMVAVQTDNTMQLIAALSDYCSDKQRLNNDFSGFIVLSQQLYQRLFKPLHLPPGKVILCPDRFLFPFEALCADGGGAARFLVYDYAFSYVYSAEHLLSLFEPGPAKGNFAGFAPVTFRAELRMPELKRSAFFLEQSAGWYNSKVLYTGLEASRDNFMKVASGYSIVNVFSHAVADTGNTEPLLYFQDSVLPLSELRSFNRPATRFIMLSACMTNVGKYAAGEGVYSMARGFTAVGIPAVAATLWRADEKTVYEITGKLNEYLSAGMRKDEALQKAKLYFMKQGEKERELPYYWANMILMGNPEPVSLLPGSVIKPDLVIWVLILATGGVVLSAWVVLKKRRGAGARKND